MRTLVAETRALVSEARRHFDGSPQAEAVEEISERLDAPLRVAIAGQIKGGKSTLLNAIVGAKLAPTDATECTRIVSWYEDGHTYGAEIHTKDGKSHPTTFSAEGGAIDVDLQGRRAEDVERLVVRWPSDRLQSTTLIDTPGIESINAHVSARTREFLNPGDHETPADAVVYLMRHLHGGDVDLLRAFHDNAVSEPNPINTVGVLARADEAGACRLDAMDAAARISARMYGQPAVRRLVQCVVPVAGLVAEASATLTESEFRDLQRLAELPPELLDLLLVSVGQFAADVAGVEIAAARREQLLGRLGLYGVRVSIEAVRQGEARTARELSEVLARRSGLDELRTLLDTLFLERRDALKCRSALLALHELLDHQEGSEVRQLLEGLERVLASAHELTELAMLSELRSGRVAAPEATVDELDRLLGGSGSSAFSRLHLDPEATTEEILAAAHSAVVRWQRRVELPMTTHELAVLGRAAIRSLEGLIANMERTP